MVFIGDDDSTLDLIRELLLGDLPLFPLPPPSAPNDIPVSDFIDTTQPFTGGGRIDPYRGVEAYPFAEPVAPMIWFGGDSPQASDLHLPSLTVSLPQVRKFEIEWMVGGGGGDGARGEVVGDGEGAARGGGGDDRGRSRRRGWETGRLQRGL